MDGPISEGSVRDKPISEGSVRDRPISDGCVRWACPGHARAVTRVPSTFALFAVSICTICTPPADHVCCWGVAFMTSPLVLFGVCCFAFFTLYVWLCVARRVFLLHIPQFLLHRPPCSRLLLPPCTDVCDGKAMVRTCMNNDAAPARYACNA